MKSGIKFWVIEGLIVVVVIFLILFSAAYVFVGYRGNDIIIRQLEEATGRKVSIGYFNLTLPFNLEIRNLEIDGLAKVDNAYISASPFSFLTGKIVLNSAMLLGSEILINRVPPQVISSPGLASNASSLNGAKKIKAAGKKRTLFLIVKRLELKESKIDFTDHKVGTEGIRIKAKGVNFLITNFYTYPYSTISEFKVSGLIPWEGQKEEGKFEAEGWLNLYKKDMQASITIEDIDGLYLYPYYSQWVDLENAGVEKAKLTFTSNAQSLNNSLFAECHLELTDIVRKERALDQPQERAEKIRDVVLKMMQSQDEEGKIKLDFAVKTKMDRPEFGFGQIKTAVETKLTKGKTTQVLKPETFLLMPLRIVEGTIKGATDITTAVIGGTFAVGKQVKDSLKASFTRELKEGQEEEQ